MKRWMKLAAAGAAVVLLAGAYAWVQFQNTRRTEKAREAFQTIPLTAIPTDALVAFSNTIGVELVKSGDTWTAPRLPNAVLDQEEIKGVAFTVSNLGATKIIDEAPADLAAYGFDKPTVRAWLTEKDKQPLEVVVGSKTPGHDAYYVRIGDDPKVYTINTFAAGRLAADWTTVRDKKLPMLEPTDVVYLRIRGQHTIEIEKLPEGEPSPALVGSYRMTKPFRVHRGVDQEKLSEVLAALQGLRVRRFVDDAPRNLAAYGLDRPVFDVFARSDKGSVHLLVGAEAGRREVYAKIEGRPSVFTIDDIRDSLGRRPFDFADHFALIVDIAKVDRFTVEGRGRSIVGEIRRESVPPAAGAEKAKEADAKPPEPEIRETYFINGTQVEERPFKNFYQACIGLIADAENTKPVTARPEITITYSLNVPGSPTPAISLARVSRDFYAVIEKNGVSELLVDVRQVEAIFKAAADLGIRF